MNCVLNIDMRRTTLTDVVRDLRGRFRAIQMIDFVDNWAVVVINDYLHPLHVGAIARELNQDGLRYIQPGAIAPEGFILPGGVVL